MNIIEILIIAVGLAMDAFAVSISVGASGRATGARSSLRLAFHLGLFQFLMPVVGWFVGEAILPLIEKIDHWIAFALLAFVALRMIRTAVSEEKIETSVDPTKGLSLVSLSVATSIDALAVGMSLAMIQVNIWYPSAVIGVVTATLSLIALRTGSRIGLRFGKRMEIFGGMLLILIGVGIVVQHAHL
jgi:putative Mn2+ efflux pump MntP